MTVQGDRENLEGYEVMVREWLRDKRVPPTIQNVVHALADEHQLDFMGGDEIVPECPPITWWQAFLGLFRRPKVI